MGLIPWRFFLMAIVTIVGLLFVTGDIGTFGLMWTPNPKHCTESYAYSFGEWKSLIRVAHVELRYRPATLKCPGFEYDPRTFKPLSQVMP